MTIVSRRPIGLDDLVRLIEGAHLPLGVQGIDDGVSAAILHPDGNIACTVSAPLRILAPEEFERVLPGETLDEERDLFWHSATMPFSSGGVGHELLDRIAEMVEGRVISTPRARLDDEEYR